MQTIDCHKCEALLYEYVQAAPEDRSGKAQWRQVTLHLETCPHCSGAYSELSELIELAYGERGVEPPHYPDPDLSFLHQEKDKPPQPIHIPWRLDELGRLIIEFSAELLRALQPPAFQPAYAMARVKSDKSSRILCQFSLKEAVEDLEVTITAEEARDDPAHSQITVQINIPSRGGWPNLADTEVSLKQDERELETQLTDAFGNAVFKGIAIDDLAHLVFEISPFD